MTVDPHLYSPDHQAMGDCRVCGHDAAAPWHNIEPAHRASTLRMLMEAKWRDRQVTNAHHRCKWIMPVALGGDHGFLCDLADNNITGGHQ